MGAGVVGGRRWREDLKETLEGVNICIFTSKSPSFHSSCSPQWLDFQGDFAHEPGMGFAGTGPGDPPEPSLPQVTRDGGLQRWPRGETTVSPPPGFPKSWDEQLSPPGPVPSSSTEESGEETGPPAGVLPPEEWSLGSQDPRSRWLLRGFPRGHQPNPGIRLHRSFMAESPTPSRARPLCQSRDDLVQPAGPAQRGYPWPGRKPRDWPCPRQPAPPRSGGNGPEAA